MRITEDFCRCGHVASAHHDGDGACRDCHEATRHIWSQFTRCHRFVWSMTWEERAAS